MSSFFSLADPIFSGHLPRVGPQEAHPAVAGAPDVPLRTLPRLQQGGQGQQRQGQVPLQDEDAGKSAISLSYFIYSVK